MLDFTGGSGETCEDTAPTRSHSLLGVTADWSAVPLEGWGVRALAGGTSACLGGEGLPCAEAGAPCVFAIAIVTITQAPGAPRLGWAWAQSSGLQPLITGSEQQAWLVFCCRVPPAHGFPSPLPAAAVPSCCPLPRLR